mgnify:CR=1 FL=1
MRACKVCGIPKPLDEFREALGTKLVGGEGKVYNRRVCYECEARRWEVWRLDQRRTRHWPGKARLAAHYP